MWRFKADMIVMTLASIQLCPYSDCHDCPQIESCSHLISKLTPCPCISSPWPLLLLQLAPRLAYYRTSAPTESPPASIRHPRVFPSCQSGSLITVTPSLQTSLGHTHLSLCCHPVPAVLPPNIVYQGSANFLSGNRK